MKRLRIGDRVVYIMAPRIFTRVEPKRSREEWLDRMRGQEAKELQDAIQRSRRRRIARDMIAQGRTDGEVFEATLRESV